MLASTSRWIPTNRSNPCPICSDISGDCRHGETLILCHTYIDGGVDAPGYEFKKSGKLGNWGVYAPPRENKDWLPKELWIRQQQQLRAKREADKRRQYQEALSAPERNKAIRKIAKLLGLKAEHREDLKRRGLNDSQIEKGLFFSVESNVKLPSDIPTNLPGVGHGGRLLSNASGYACIAFDHEGRAIGWQIRIDGATESGKYRWAKGLKSSHLKNGELPITVVGETSTTTINLTEGILKPYIAQSKHGGKWLGSPGGNFSGSPKQFKAAVAGYDLINLMP
ncbi:MAG: hypothetical protein WBG70_20875, partial [Spirulinaceae cyanobacterium]